MPAVGIESTTPRKIGRYALHGEIASGGMATVHYGRLLGPVGFSRTVAIKRLHPIHARDPEFVSMFLDEARLAARIRHPNVVPTLDVVAASGELFLVMDWVQGESLAALLRVLRARGERMPPPVAASIISGVLQGLHAAHEAKDERGMALGIVHRDVSPQNVMVGVDGLARVLDFGIAKATVRVGTTRDGQIKGKLSYMAPEQLRAEALTRDADIYAASVVLWEMIAGEKLFAGDSEGVVIGRILQGDVPVLRNIVPSIPAALEAVTMRGMARDATARYKTARDMAVAVENCITTASAAEVSAWLEKVAAPTLSERAAIVAKIEAEDRAPQSLPDALEEITPDGSLSRRRTSQEETVSVLWQPAADLGLQVFGDDSGATALSFSKEPPARRNRLALLMVGSVAVFAMVAIGAVRHGSTAPAPKATTVVPPATTDARPPTWPGGSASGAVQAQPSPSDSADPVPTGVSVDVPFKPRTVVKKVATPVKPKSKGTAFDDLGGRD